MNEGSAQPGVARYVGVGCLMAISGFFGGGMIAVAIGKVVGSLQRCKPDAGLPACNWFEYLAAGALVGMILLPSVVIWRLRQGPAATDHSQRG